MPRLVLHCFRASHFNEKAHWGLNRKGLAYDVVEHWPGPHAIRVTRLSGQATTPVLEIDDRVVVGSTAILLALDELVPDRPLFPADPSERIRCMGIIEEFDEQVGPAVRLALFFDLLNDLDAVARIFVREPWGMREHLYRAALPAVRVVMKWQMKIDAQNAAAARKTIAGALDRLAREGGATGHPLVGEHFTAADLTAAALLSIVKYPDGFHAEMPLPRPPAMRAFEEEWAAHSGMRWVEAMYASHRSR